MAKAKGKTQIPEAEKAASPAQESKEAAPTDKTFHEYPAAQGTIKDEQGT